MTCHMPTPCFCQLLQKGGNGPHAPPRVPLPPGRQRKLSQKELFSDRPDIATDLETLGSKQHATIMSQTDGQEKTKTTSARRGGSARKFFIRLTEAPRPYSPYGNSCSR